MSNDELVFIGCPPLSDYPEAPVDHSASQLFDCPQCKNKMWISEKMKGIILFNACLDRNILLRCYECLKEQPKQNPEFFSDSEMVKI